MCVCVCTTSHKCDSVRGRGRREPPGGGEIPQAQVNSDIKCPHAVWPRVHKDGDTRMGIQIRGWGYGDGDTDTRMGILKDKCTWKDK